MAIRLIFFFLCGAAGLYVFSWGLEAPTVYYVGILGGAFTAGMGFLLEHSLRRVHLSVILGGAIGLLAGALAAGLLGLLGGAMVPDRPEILLAPRAFLFLILGYLGLTIGLKLGASFKGQKIGTLGGPAVSGAAYKLLDTSVIIDGRIADLCETGFIEGTFIIPHFILEELQHIADSSDSLKRARGRRGLDILNRVQKMVDIEVTIVDTDFPHIREVDSKLVALAREMDARIVTNDLNLNKVAELQGVRVLNINELCNALRPVVLPGEAMRVFILKEGKEAGQGVGYLDDGTMIVVDNAKRFIGKTIDVAVTSVLQTTAGRMIFTRLREEGDKERERDKEEIQVGRANG
jgi:uncharacterized protein YacL